jgi:hypothetical protein
MIAIPERMRELPLDSRGYPIPVIVYRDTDGKPHFTINDSRAVDRVIRYDLCAICGTKLWRGRWFVGGPGSAFHEHGAYLDPPLHAECCEYALQVCPYLAAPKYAKRIDAKTLNPAKLNAALLVDHTQDPNRPETFVAVLARGQKMTDNGYFRPVRPYIAVHYWRAGKRVRGI